MSEKGLQPTDGGDPTAPYLAGLEEATMRLAWGDRTPEERRRIVLAALIFGEQFRERSVALGPSPDEAEVQRLLMGLMSAVVREFARLEGLGPDEAAALLGEVRTRDLVLEFDEVVSTAADSDRSLDAVFRETVAARQQRAVWSDHWTSG